MLMLAWNPPHAVFTDAPVEKRALYPDGVLSHRGNYRPPQGIESPAAVYQGYHAHISAIDEEVGRVLARLEELDLDRRTIVIYTSDHGAMQGSFGLTNKRLPYEESIRIPFLVRAPGLVPPGTRVEALFGAIDMAPTIAGLAGVAPLPGWVGQDHSPWLRGERGPEPAGQPIAHILNRRTEHLPPAQRPAPRFRGIRTARWTYAVRRSAPWLL
ncbi:MAG: sulfatase-like hydrolase/transferase, partial [Candidatus Poseidoniia archaeon]